MTHTVLITTTINVPHVLAKWAKGLTVDDVIIVAGDKKSPHDEIIDVLDVITLTHGITTRYLHPDDQIAWASSEAIGWNSIQRRNIALLEAMKLNPQYILTVDDDNIPTMDNQIGVLRNRMTVYNDDIKWVATNTGWENPCWGVYDYDHNEIVHRGFPLNQRGVRTYRNQAAECKIGVGAMFWTGDPDIDGVDRLVNGPLVESITDQPFVLTPGTWGPFNSQATMYRAELAPLMMVWPGVGRYDDIWASYLARKVMDHFGYGVYYGHPVVHQDRNEHDLTKDIEAEIHGMRWTPRLCEILREIDLSKQSTITSAMQHVHAMLTWHDEIIPPQLTHAFAAWQQDLETLKWED